MSENSSIYLKILEKLKENKNLILNDILKFIFSDCINLNDNLNFISFIFQVFLSKIDLTFKEIWNVIKIINLIRKSNLFEKNNQGIIFILNLYKICIKLLTEKINIFIPSKNFDDFKEIIIIIEIISSYNSLFICENLNYKNEIEIINEYIKILFKNIEILAKEKNNKILLNLLNINNFNKNNNNNNNKEENNNKNQINFNNNNNNNNLNNNNNNNNKSFDLNKKYDFSRNKKGNIFNVHTNYNNINIISQNKNHNLNKTYSHSRNKKFNNKTFHSFSYNKSFSKKIYFNNKKFFNNHKKNYFNSEKKEITINSIKNSNNFEINKKIINDNNINNNNNNENNNNNNNENNNNNIKKIKQIELISKFTEELNMQIYYFSDYSIEINKILNLNNFTNEFKKIKPNLKIIRFGSFNICTLSPYKKDCNIDLMICEKGKKSEFSHLYEITQRIKNFKEYSLNFNISKEQKNFDLENNCVSFILNHNFKNIIVHLYLNNDIFRFSSLLIKKIYMNCKNILYLHFIVSEELIIELKLFNTNFELSVLILNFFQYYFKIFLIEEKKYNNFTYFSLKKEEKISYNSNIIKKITEKFIIEFDEKVYDLINKNYLKIIKIKFFEFVYFYFNWIFSNQNNSNNNIFFDNYFSQKDFILSRTFIDNKISNSFKHNEKILRNNIQQLLKKINNLKSNKN